MGVRRLVEFVLMMGQPHLLGLGRVFDGALALDGDLDGI